VQAPKPKAATIKIVLSEFFMIFLLSHTRPKSRMPQPDFADDSGLFAGAHSPDYLVAISCFLELHELESDFSECWPAHRQSSGERGFIPIFTRRNPACSIQLTLSRPALLTTYFRYS
jgi:hypothetical protein